MVRRLVCSHREGCSGFGAERRRGSGIKTAIRKGEWRRARGDETSRRRGTSRRRLSLRGAANRRSAARYGVYDVVVLEVDDEGRIVPARDRRLSHGGLS